MRNLFIVAGWGILISFLGCLPLGTLNITTMLIAIQENSINACWFSLGCLLVEMAYVRISLLGIAWLRNKLRWLKMMEWLTLGIIIALATGSFHTAIWHSAAAPNPTLQNGIPRFWLGVLMSAINPMQFPFWFGWSNVLFEKGTLQPVISFYNSYIVGIGAGTLLGSSIFIFGGQWMALRVNGFQQQLNWVIGIIFAITALIWLYKILRKKDALSKLNDSIR